MEGIRIEEFESLVRRSRGEGPMDKRRLLRRIQRGGYKLSLARTGEYLKMAQSVGFIEIAVLKRILKELVNLDVSIGIHYDLLAEDEWEQLYALAVDEARCIVEGRDAEMGVSPVGSPISSSDEREPGKEHGAEVKNKISIMVRAFTALADFFEEKTSRDVFVALMEWFEHLILPSTGSVCMQFVMFAFCSVDEYGCNGLVGYLVNGIVETYDPRRGLMAMYLASFLSRCGKLAADSVDMFESDFVGFVRKRTEERGADGLNGVLLQSAMYVVFNWKKQGRPSLPSADVITRILQLTPLLVACVDPAIQQNYKDIVNPLLVPARGSFTPMITPFDKSPIAHIHEKIRYWRE